MVQNMVLESTQRIHIIKGYCFSLNTARFIKDLDVDLNGHGHICTLMCYVP